MRARRRVSLFRTARRRCFRALVFGAGTLLRAIRYGARTFALEEGEYRFMPTNPYRINYLARHFDNWYHRAGADEQLRYVDDLALWGSNGFQMQLDYPVVDTAKIDESSFLARDAHNPTALAAYAELTNIYHCERQNAELLDRTWRGYTCPPFADNDIWARHR